MPFADLLVSVSGALHDWLKNGRQGAGQVRNLLGNNIFWDSSIQNDTIHDNDLLKTEKLFLCVFRIQTKTCQNYPRSHRSAKTIKCTVLCMPGQAMSLWNEHVIRMCMGHCIHKRFCCYLRLRK